MNARGSEMIRVLFSPFFREVGNPYRKVIRGYQEFLRFVNQNNGIRDCFVSVYDLSYRIDKIFFDLDYLDIKTAWRFYEFVTEELNLSCVPVASGKKGFHFYVLFKPKRFKQLDEAIATIRKVAFTIIDEGKFYVEKNGYKRSIFDTRVIGDLRRMTRIPNTMRIECKTYCTYLPPDFSYMSLDEFLNHIKEPHEYEYQIKRTITVDQFETTDAYYDFVLTPQTVQSESSTSKYVDNRLLKLVLRPCLYKQIIQEEPPHEIRTAATIDLLHGFTVDEIVEIYKQLGWVDFNEKITRYHVNHLAQKVYNGCLKPYSCRKLRSLGYCLGKECDW